MQRQDDLSLITDALHEAGEMLRRFASREVEVRYKSGGSPVTDADIAVDRMLRARLLRRGEGWLSEEHELSDDRLRMRRVWIVDPLDGTNEFIARVPEWCVSIGLAEDGAAVAGGVYNPVTHEMIVGAVGSGLSLNGRAVAASSADNLRDATVLASRSEYARGEWTRFEKAGLRIRAVGSVAYKMGLVAAGLGDATWTLAGKHEWDVAAGTALVQAAGGTVRTLDWRAPKFNCRAPLLTGIVACAPGLADAVRRALTGP